MEDRLEVPEVFHDKKHKNKKKKKTKQHSEEQLDESLELETDKSEDVIPQLDNSSNKDLDVSGDTGQDADAMEEPEIEHEGTNEVSSGPVDEHDKKTVGGHREIGGFTLIGSVRQAKVEKVSSFFPTKYTRTVQRYLFI